MYCTHCGAELGSDMRFCPKCGFGVDGARPFVPPGMVRPRAGRKIAGVCAGLARYYGWDLTVVRLVAVVTLLCTGIGLGVYVIGWIVMPDEPAV